jgi:hypothetical protein
VVVSCYGAAFRATAKELDNAGVDALHHSCRGCDAMGPQPEKLHQRIVDALLRCPLSSVMMPLIRTMAISQGKRQVQGTHHTWRQPTNGCHLEPVRHLRTGAGAEKTLGRLCQGNTRRNGSAACNAHRQNTCTDQQGQAVALTLHACFTT